MTDEPAIPEGLKVEQARIYYDPESGEIVHVHQLVSAPGEELDVERVEEEMKTFEEGLRERYDKLEYLVVAATDLPALGEATRVDVEQQKLVRG